MRSLTHGQPDDACWTEERERLLVRAADALHETSTIGDGLWAQLVTAFTEPQLLDLMFLCGWYHAISYAANAAGVALEPDAPRFADVAWGPVPRRGRPRRSGRS